jgi:hypothetical protein
METLCPSVESNSEAVHDELTLGGILGIIRSALTRNFTPVVLRKSTSLLVSSPLRRI